MSERRAAVTKAGHRRALRWAARGLRCPRCNAQQLYLASTRPAELGCYKCGSRIAPTFEMSRYENWNGNFHWRVKVRSLQLIE